MNRTQNTLLVAVWPPECVVPIQEGHVAGLDRLRREERVKAVHDFIRGKSVSTRRACRIQGQLYERVLQIREEELT